MPDLKDGFRHFFTPDQGQEEKLLRTGLVAVDTNVLLDLYKYSPKALSCTGQVSSSSNGFTFSNISSILDESSSNKK